MTLWASPAHDCGPRGRTGQLLYAGSTPPAVDVDSLFWGVIPAVWTFQHWVQNTLPKLAQARAEAGLPPPHRTDTP